jgi:hypothetical protein
MSHYVVIQGDQARKIERSDSGELTASFSKEFEIEGKDSGASAIVMLMIRGLTGDADPIAVHLNGKPIGRLYPNPSASPDSWFTQILHFSASEGSLFPNAKSNETKNLIQIPGDGDSAKFDKFYVQNIVCFYKPEG